MTIPDTHTTVHQDGDVALMRAAPGRYYVTYRGRASHVSDRDLALLEYAARIGHQLMAAGKLD